MMGMKFVQLLHHVSLGMPRGKQLLKLSQSFLDECNCGDCDYLITFRLPPKKIVEKHVHNIHACVRLNALYDGNISFYALETDSPFAPLILWDIAHTLSIGRILRFYGDHSQEPTLSKKYYQGAFRIVETGPDYIAFQKIAALPVETDRGLDDWTFGIPTGPGDATILNAAVKRILEIPCRNKEIILCGRPGENFKYWDQVKVVGEDITAPPVQIAKKKNRIAEHASYGNLCILHDRVFLPSDFMDAMRKYGDDYSVTTLQSVYFDDYHNLCPHRYSDYAVIETEDVSNGIEGIDRQGITLENIKSNTFSPDIVGIVSATNIFVPQNPLLSSPKTYATGSMYIAKRCVWQLYPQNDGLTWEKFEDVEWGLRMSKAGVFHRINPYSFSQSILARPLLLGDYRFILPNGKKRTKYIKRWMLPMKCKPLIKCTEEAAWDKLLQFKARYCPDVQLQIRTLTSEYRAQIVLQLLNSTRFELDKGSIQKFIHDVESLLLQGSFPQSFKNYILSHFLIHGKIAMRDIMIYYDFEKQLSLRLKKSQFMRDASDYGVPHSFTLHVGTWISAFFFWLRNKKFYFNPNGLRGYNQAILSSTPYLEYFEGD